MNKKYGINIEFTIKTKQLKTDLALIYMFMKMCIYSCQCMNTTILYRSFYQSEAGKKVKEMTTEELDKVSI